MGGKAAKERRRLKRLGLEASDTNLSSLNDGAVNDTSKANRTKKPLLRQRNAPVAGGRFSGRIPYDRAPRGKPTFGGKMNTAHAANGRPWARNSFNRGVGGNSVFRVSTPHGNGVRSRENRSSQRPVIKATKKKKIAKPKHLKRKLEQAADHESRETIMNEMKQWEEQKKRKQTPKRQKTMSLASHSVSSTDGPARQASEPVPGATPAGSVAEAEEVVDIEPKLQPKESVKGPGVTTCPELKPCESNEDQLKVDVDGEPALPQIKGNTDLSPPVDRVKEENHIPNDSDSESDVSLNEPLKRQRGRRRRGRKQSEKHDCSGTSNSSLVVPETEEPAAENALQDNTHTDLESKNRDVSAKAEKIPKKDDQRRCIGRKPVTDFVVGQRYEGKVVYIRPFGVFIDIGCHSDAFCHVSRINDNYIESPNDALKVGEQVSARVVEVDRKQKRLTVSLQSDARLEDERASMEAKRLRSEKLKLKKPHAQQHDTQSTKERQLVKEPTPPDSINDSPRSHLVDESHMTPSELKRARKLARRADRRARKAQTGISEGGIEETREQ